MEVLTDKTDGELTEVMLKEVAKAFNEIQCADRDIQKAKGRLGFSLVLINVLLDRKAGKIDQSKEIKRS